jgi:ABC-type multidrug transport system ATPase subunit
MSQGANQSGHAGASAVSAQGLTKRYGRTVALDAVSFAVQAGEAVALWGPNGAGKTTILRCLLGLARYAGDVRVLGADPVRDGRTARRQIGYVPQDLPVTTMTVDEMVAFIARLKDVPFDQARQRLAQLGIAAQGDKAVGALSGGMKQRLALALALIGSPPILLLDEPTANLDARGRAELLQLLRQLKGEGMTLIFSSHRPEDVLALADRVLLLESGRLRGSVEPAAFVEELGKAARVVLFLRNGYRREAIETLAKIGLAAEGHGQVVSVAVQTQQKAAVIAALAGAGIEIDDFDVERVPWTERS